MFSSPFLRSCRSCLLNFLFRSMIGVFLSVYRSDVWRVSIQIRSADTKFTAVCVDPIPKKAARHQALRGVLAIGAHDVGCKAVSVASTPAAAVIRSIVGRL